jgi:glycosyltransferase involved in cell wall biosynthesis
MRASVVLTVKNEGNTVLQLLSSLRHQSLRPHEVIIVDGGSTDGTVEIIRSFIKSNKPFKLIIANGTNRGEGRNIGISAITSDVVALTDGGVVPDKTWLENITKPIAQTNADFVGGVYVQTGENTLQKCIGVLQYPKLTKLRADSFLPSCRSVAFRKHVWETVGRWPEHLEKAEDTFFDLMVKKNKFKTALATNAIVAWPARDSLGKLFSQYSSYAEWDAKARLLSRVSFYRLMILAYILLAVSLASVFAFGFLGFLLSSLTALAYLIFNGVKAFLKTRRPSSFYLAPAVKATIFLAETYGIAVGVASRIRGFLYKQPLNKRQAESTTTTQTMRADVIRRKKKD